MTSLRDLVGTERVSGWIEVGQERIDAFAAATDDPQWIHVDPERAATGPFGTTIAHGYLTLSLCVPMLYEVFPPAGGMLVNYGVNRVRFPALSIEEAAGGERATIEAVVECEGVEKPVCVAELVLLTLP